MTLKEKMLSVYRRKGQGSIPWAAYLGLLPAGMVERDVRNHGCGVIYWAPIYSWLPPGMGHMKGWDFESEIRKVELSVGMVWEEGERTWIRSYTTPIGSVSEKLRQEPGYGSLWTKEFFIKTPHDYDVVKYMVENTVYREQYDSFQQAQDIMSDDGVVMAVGDRSPWQKILIELTGTERLYLDLHDRPKVVEDLFACIEQKQDEAYEIAASSPAELIWVPDNLSGDLTPPKVFEKYCVPFYNSQARRLHRSDKTVVVHMDGKLRSLKDLIGQTEIDVVESFTFPEAGGNLPLEEASEAWKDKSIMANLPASLCFDKEREVRDYIEQLLTRISPRKNFMLEISENLPYPYWKTTLRVVAEAMQEQ